MDSPKRNKPSNVARQKYRKIGHSKLFDKKNSLSSSKRRNEYSLDQSPVSNITNPYSGGGQVNSKLTGR